MTVAQGRYCRILTLFFIFTFMTACGRRGAPIAPEDRPSKVIENNVETNRKD
jgi:hypothetical protein